MIEKQDADLGPQDELHPIVTFMDALVTKVKSGALQMPYSRKVLPLCDPQLPARNVAGFFKTQLDAAVRQLEDEEAQ